MISPFCSGGHEALSGHQSFVFILICLTEKAQVVVLTKLPDPMCHASTCMTLFSHVLFGYSFIANYLETALLILYSQENNHPLTPNIFCLLCKLRGKKTSRKAPTNSVTRILLGGGVSVSDTFRIRIPSDTFPDISWKCRYVLCWIRKSDTFGPDGIRPKPSVGPISPPHV